MQPKRLAAPPVPHPAARLRPPTVQARLQANPPGTRVIQRSSTTVSVVPQTWFHSSGSLQADEPRLIDLLYNEYRRGNVEFQGTCDEVEIGGLRKAYNAGIGTYATIRDFAQACSDQTDWGNDGTRLAELFDHKINREYESNLPVVTERDRWYFMEQVEEIAKSKSDSRRIYEIGIREEIVEVEPGVNQPVQVSDYDKPFAWEGDLWTDGMGPCITVGLTGTHMGKRYNGMLHSFHPDASGIEILKSLRGHFKTGNELPVFSSLKDVRYFAVGGSTESQKKADSILRSFREEGLNVLGVALTTDSNASELTKAAHLTSSGELYFSQHDPRKKVKSGGFPRRW